VPFPTVDEVVERLPGDAQGLGSLGGAQAQSLQAIVPHNLAVMDGSFLGWRVIHPLADRFAAFDYFFFASS
jgi:hypothetical protein